MNNVIKLVISIKSFIESLLLLVLEFTIDLFAGIGMAVVMLLVILLIVFIAGAATIVDLLTNKKWHLYDTVIEDLRDLANDDTN